MFNFLKFLFPSKKQYISKDVLQKCIPNAKFENIDLFHEPINSSLELYKIDTTLRISHFLAQIAHESNNLNTLEENLNYSSAGLIKVFPKYFRTVNASEYHRQPEKIANHVYSNRMGNGAKESGDGWKYRGRGLIQITGKFNYADCGRDLGIDLINNPDLLLKPEFAARSAGWFWNKKNLNFYADKNDINIITKLINGGYNGLEFRKMHYEKIKKILG